MADEVEAPPAGDSAGKKSRMVPALMIVALMGLEGVGVFFVARAMSGGPSESLGETGESGTGEGAADPDAESVEIEVATCRPTNTRLGRTLNLDVRVSVLVAEADRDSVEKMVEARKGRILDRVNTVFRSADPKHLDEPELQTLERRLRHELDAVFGDDQVIREVLITHFAQSGPGV